MTQELYISGQLMDLDPNTEVVLDYKSNIFGDISKIEGSHSYTIQLPKTRQNLRVLKDPGNPARRSDTARRYLQAKYYRNGIDLFGDCMAVILGDSSDGIQIALTMQGLRSLATWSEAGGSIRDLYNNHIVTGWNSVSAYQSMLDQGQGIARVNAGINMETVTEAFYPPAVSLNNLFMRIMAATGVQNYSIPNSVQQDMRSLFLPFVDIIGGNFHLRNEAWSISTGRVTEPARNAVHLHFSSFNIPATEWVYSTESFWLPDGSDTFIMGLYAEMPAGTFNTTGTTYLRVMGSIDNRDVELDSMVIQVEADGSAVLSYDERKNIDVANSREVWVEVSNVATGTHTAKRDSSYSFMYQGQRAERPQDLLIGRNLPDIKQLELLKFICHFYGLAILPSGVDGLNFVPYSSLEANKTIALDWSDRLLGDTSEDQRGEVGFVLSDFAQKNLISWTAEDNLEYKPADGILVVNDATIQDEKTLATLPFSASHMDSYPIFGATANDDGSHEVTVNGLKPRIFRLTNREESAALAFSPDMNLPIRMQAYYKEYQNIIRVPITQKVECRLTERDLKDLDFSIPVYFRQFGQYYAIESVRTSSKSDICEIKMIQI